MSDTTIPLERFVREVEARVNAQVEMTGVARDIGGIKQEMARVVAANAMAVDHIEAQKREIADLKKRLDGMRISLEKLVGDADAFLAHAMGKGKLRASKTTIRLRAALRASMVSSFVGRKETKDEIPF